MNSGGLHPHRAVCLQVRALAPGDLLQCMSPVVALNGHAAAAIESPLLE